MTVVDDDNRTLVKHKTKPLRKILLLCTFACLCLSIGSTHLSRYHRTLRFWNGIAPLVIEYNFLRFRRWMTDDYDDNDNDNDNDNDDGPIEGEEEGGHKARMKRFHERSAPRLTSLMVSLGGMSIKIGQMLSLLTGLLPEPYINSLSSLQDGVPARDYSEISKIIESSTGRRMEDMFHEFEEVPIGAASIGQAHRAVLKLPDRNATDTDTYPRVIVKVQYSEVAEDFHTDFDNVQLAGRFINIGHADLLRSIRERHAKELDFRIEARNLREVRRNMRRHGLEPSAVRIPAVRNETGSCNDKVLVMEYLQGVGLKEVIEEEQTAFARGVGFGGGEDGLAKMKSRLRKRMLEHFENGGGGNGRRMAAIGNSRLLPAIVPAVARIIRFYGRIRQKIEDAVSFVLRRKPPRREPPPHPHGPERLEPPGKPASSSSPKPARINLTRVLKTLVHVHGVQMLVDGVFNVDPHPGNVLVLPDGRLGLLDYGMVGRYDPEERRMAAGVVKAIGRGDKVAVTEIYNKAGYRAFWKEGDMVDPEMLYRFASFHFDRLDLSDIVVDVESSGGEKSVKQRRIRVLDILKSANEHYVPIWIENGRRLSTLLYGVANEAMRPISLSKEWEDIATQVLNELK